MGMMKAMVSLRRLIVSKLKANKPPPLPPPEPAAARLSLRVLLVMARLVPPETDPSVKIPPPEALPGVLARVAKAGHRVERWLQRGKGEAGLAEYQVRTWSGWHHHQALSLIATWFLVQEARRGKKGDSGPDGPAGARRAGVAAAVGVRV